MLQPLLGYTQYEVTINTRAGAAGGKPPNLPAIEYRLTYVPVKFSYTQMCVRAFFTFTSLSMLFAYSCAILSTARHEAGQLWVTVLLVSGVE